MFIYNEMKKSRINTGGPTGIACRALGEEGFYDV
jgi:hypothetical protein